MIRPTKQLIIIPGLGDNKVSGYSVFAAVWRLLGYRTSVYTFGWDDPTSEYVQKYAAFKKYIDQCKDPVSIIGISAGGTAAVTMLLDQPDKIEKVVTVCSPYYPLNSRSPSLNESLPIVQQKLSTCDEQLKTRILSVYALQDNVVPIKNSQPAGIRSITLPSIGHVVTIALAMTIYARPLKKFLN